VLLCFVALLGLGACLGVAQWRDSVVRRQDAVRYRAACDALTKNKITEAATILRTRVAYRRPSAEVVRKWRELDVAVATQLRQLPQMLATYERWPDAISQNENASLLAARAFLQTRQKDRFDALASAWRDRSKQPQLWFALDADALLMDGKKADALVLLKSRT